MVCGPHCRSPFAGPSRATAGPGKTLLRDPITPSPPILYVLRSRRRRASRGRKCGEMCPLTIRLRIRGSIVSSPSGVRGRALAENEFYAYFRSERSHMEHHFQYFELRRGPPNITGPGKTFPPLDGPARLLSWALDGLIICRSIISSCQSAATSEIVKFFWPLIYSCKLLCSKYPHLYTYLYCIALTFDLLTSVCQVTEPSAEESYLR